MDGKDFVEEIGLFVVTHFNFAVDREVDGYFIIAVVKFQDVGTYLDFGIAGGQCEIHEDRSFGFRVNHGHLISTFCRPEEFGEIFVGE